MRLRRYRSVAVLLLTLHLQACGAWRSTTDTNLRQVIEEEQRLRVTLADGSRLDVNSATVADDSLKANWFCRTGPCAGVQQPVTFALEDVQEVEYRRFSPIIIRR